tara:strand:- start:1623 stop:2201 length:579 start_codon:yes stop_codon:yes gene_type:complete
MPEEGKLNEEASATAIPGFVLGKDKAGGELSNAKDSRFELKRDLSDDKKTMTIQVKQAYDKAVSAAKNSAREGNPQSVSDIKQNIEIESKINNSKTNLGYQKKEAMLEKIRESLKEGNGKSNIELPIKGGELEEIESEKSAYEQSAYEQSAYEKNHYEQSAYGNNAYISAYQSELASNLEKAIKDALSEGGA